MALVQTMVQAPRGFSTTQVIESPHQTSMAASATNLESTLSYEQSRRQISSVIVSEEVLGTIPEPYITYVEIPVVEEVVLQVPKKTVVEVEKVVPKYEVEYVERLVEVPEIQYIDRTVEKPEVQEIIRHVPGPKQIHEIPREVIRTVPKIKYESVEKIVEVPGEIIEVEVPQLVKRTVEVPIMKDHSVPVVVAQVIRPVITESPEPVDVDIYEYEPQVIPVDVLVAKPIESQLVAIGATTEEHRPVQVPAPQYNTILRSLNAHLPSTDRNVLPYINEADGTPAFLYQSQTPGFAYPTQAAFSTMSAVPGSHNEVTSRLHSVAPSQHKTSQIHLHGHKDIKQHTESTDDTQTDMVSVLVPASTRRSTRSTKPAHKKRGCGC